MIQINPLQSYIDGGARAAITSPPSASLVFDLPGRAIWVKGVKLKGTDHTYTFSHDTYISITNTPGSNESEDIKIGINTTLLKLAIDTTYGVVSASVDGLAPKFSNANKATASAATTYNFLGIAGSTLKWYQLPWRNVRINTESTDVLGVNSTDPLIISSGDGIEVTWDSTNKRIVITNSKPHVFDNTDFQVSQIITSTNNDYRVLLKRSANNDDETGTIRYASTLLYNPSTKILKVNGNRVVTFADLYVGATSSAAGTEGLVPAASSANRNKFLRGDGTWQVPTNDNTWRPVKVEGTQKLASTNTDALDFHGDTGIEITYDATNKKINIKNTAPDVNHNVTTTAIIGTSASATTQITAVQTNPYYNLLEGGAVTRSIQFTSNNITISSTTGGVISFIARNWTGATSNATGTAGYMPGAASTDRLKFLRGDGTWVALIASGSLNPSISDGSATNTVKITVGGEDSSNYTIPYATHSDTTNFFKAYVLESGTDINTVTDTKYYVQPGTSACAAMVNGPSGRTNGEMYLLNIRCGGNYGQLLYYSRGGNNWQWWTRTFSGTSFSNWVQIVHSGNISNKDATIGTSSTTIATIAGVDITAKIGSYATSDHTHSVKINNSTKTIAAPGGTAVDLGSYLPLTGGTLEANNSWLSPARLQLMRPDDSKYTDRACVGVTNGNLHIDAYKDYGLYLNYYSSGGAVFFNGSTYFIKGGEYNGNSATATKWKTARTLTIGSTGKSVDGSANVSWSLAEIGAASSTHTHKVKINGSEKTIAAPGGTAVDLGSYLPLAGGTMTGNIGMGGDSTKFLISSGTSGANSPLRGTKMPATSSNWIGLFARPGKATDEGGILLSEDTCVIYNSHDTGWGFLVVDTDLSQSDWSVDSAKAFGVNSSHLAWALGGFVKAGSDNTYVLLGGGGHKLISDFATSGHVHELSIATTSDTSSISLAASTKYKLTAGGSTYVFTSTPDEKVRQVPKTDNANRPLMMINGGTTAGELTTTTMFSTGIYANASTKMITANGFIKADSDSSHVLLGDGGHKAVSDFATSTHDHNSSYVTAVGNGSGDYINNLYYTLNGSNNYFTVNYATNATLLRYTDSVTTQSALDNDRHQGGVLKCYIWNGSNESTSFGTSYPGASNGIILDGGWSNTSYGFQLAIDDDPNWFIALRQRGNGTWAAWKRIPMGDGTGASGTWAISISGNAATATKLETARTINGVSFDGSANIAIAPSLLISGNTIASQVGDLTSSYITVPYATNSNTSDRSYMLLKQSGLTTMDAVNAFHNTGMLWALVSAIENPPGNYINKNDGFIISFPWGGNNYGQLFYMDDSGYTLMHRYCVQIQTSALGVTPVTYGRSWANWVKILDTSNVSPSLNIDGNTIGVTVGGIASGYITIPFATNSTTATTLTTNPSILAGTSDTNKVTITVGSKTSSEFTVPYATSAGSATWASKLYNPTQINTSDALDAFHEAYCLKAAVWTGFNTSILNSNGLVIDIGYASATYGAQILIDDDPTYVMGLRQRGGNGWNAWKRIPMGDGTGASGTWGINITGSAGSVPWSGITGKPTSKTVWGQTYCDSNGDLQSVTGRIYLPENTPHYFRDPNNGSWRGGFIWGTSGYECLSFVAVSANTKYLFICGSDISTWGSNTYASASYALEIRSTGTYAPHFYESSDARLKHDIIPISQSIRKFYFNNDDRLYYGFIAQELETLHPELVDSSGEYKTVNYNSAICYYIAELENKVQKLEDEINKLKNK